MNNTLRLLILIFGLSLAGPPVGQVAQASGSLVVYDSSGNGKLGQMYAIMLRNLLGHFEGDTIGGTPFNLADVTLLDVKDYTGQIGDPRYQAIFYLGSDYDNPAMPASFLQDVSQTPKTVVWFKYNLWKLAWDPAYSAWSQDIGFSFVQLRGVDGDPAASPPNFFQTVTYKSQSFQKYYDYSGGVIQADPDVGQMAIVDSTRAEALVPIKNAVTSEEIPYVVQSKSRNFWYVADIPFSYIGPRDRYLVFADLLHDMLGSNHAESHKALIRLEDVGALVDPTSMQTLTDYMNPRQIPFSIAVIPFYRDPFGIWNGGKKEEIHLDEADASALRASLDYALPRGGRVLLHGYTHQFASTVCNWDNPSATTCDYGNQYRQISAEDFEFWDRPANTPVKGDSAKWATDRYDNGLDEMTTRLAKKNLPTYPPFAWEVPHYQASPTDYKAFVAWAQGNTSRPQKTYQRVVYYTSDDPDFTKGDIAAGQFFPYPVRDYYGQRVLPENLGNIEYDICNVDPTSCGVIYTADDIITNAQRALVVRDGYASWFFHPFWLEDGLVPGNPGYTDFTKVMEGITALDYLGYRYQWVDPANL